MQQGGGGRGQDQGGRGREENFEKHESIATAHIYGANEEGTNSEEESEDKKEINLKRDAKIKKIPGGRSEDSTVLTGVMFLQEVTYPKTKRRSKNPRIRLLDCHLEYKKGGSQTNIKIRKKDDDSKTLEREEAYIKKIGDQTIAVKPELGITEKGVSYLAQHLLNKIGVTAAHERRKSNNLRVARPCGATNGNRMDETTEEDVGTGAGLVEVRKTREEYVAFIEPCKEPKASTILLREARRPGGASRPKTSRTWIRAKGEPASGRTRFRGWKLQGRGRAEARTARPSSSTFGLVKPHHKDP